MTLRLPVLPDYEVPVDPDYAGAILTSWSVTYLLAVWKMIL